MAKGRYNNLYRQENHKYTQRQCCNVDSNDSEEEFQPNNSTYARFFQSSYQDLHWKFDSSYSSDSKEEILMQFGIESRTVKINNKLNDVIKPIFQEINIRVMTSMRNHNLLKEKKIRNHKKIERVP